MNRNPVRKALLERRVTIGTWIQIGHPAVAEVLAKAGFDWVAADLEHTDMANAEFTALVRALHGRGTVPLARVRENDTVAIRQVLDAGAQGVVVPLVHTAEDAEAAVRAAKYPPRGVRGFAFTRANEWGVEFDDCAAQANGEAAVVVMIESESGVANIDAILAVDGVDGVFIGPYDLSGSYGVPGQTDHPRVEQGCDRVLRACSAAGKAAGVHVVLPEKDAIERTLERGFTFLAVGMDTVFLRAAALDALSASRRQS